MAIDSASKRKSVAGITVGWGITPDGTPGAEWRQQVAWTYSGIATASPGDNALPPRDIYEPIYMPLYESLYGGFEDEGED